MVKAADNMEHSKVVRTMEECGPNFDKVEWWDMCRRVKPHLTWEEYEELWDEFLEFKRWKKLQ